MSYTLMHTRLLNGGKSFCGLKVSSTSNGDRSELFVNDKYFLKLQYLHIDCFLSIIYIPSYRLQYSLISFFKVLTDLQAKVFLKLVALLT